MGKWEEKKLSEIYDVRDGTHDSPKYVLDGYPLVTSKNLKSNSIDLSNVKYISQEDYDSINKRSNVEIGDILFAMIGTIGNPVLIKEEPNYAIKNVALFKKKDKDQDPKFLTYYLGFEKTLDKMISEAKGATQKFVGLTYLRNFKIPLPPLPEQQRIVAKLDSLFAKIDQAIGLLEENIAHTQALMGSVLDAEFGRLEEIDFEPFINAVFIQNKTLVPNDQENYNYVGLENIESNTGKLVDFSKTIGEKIKSSKVYFEEGDVLYGKLRPYLNKVWVSSFDGVATTEILPFKPNQDRLTPRYLAYYLRSNTFLNVVNANTSGARMPRASARFFKDIAKVPKVNLAHQNKMVLKFDKLFNHFEKVIVIQTQKLNHLKALRRSLLDQAFKGEL